MQQEEMTSYDFAALRKTFHQHPELSLHEFLTNKRINDFLQQQCSPTNRIQKVGKTGVLVTFDSGQPGHHILFRGDIDALPIQEVNDFDYCSVVDGVSHKCGHDGHTTTLLALAHRFSQQPPTKGKASLLFQPSEEDGRGAEAVLSDVKFDIEPDFVFAYHNLPGFPLNQIVVRHGSFTAAVTSLIVKFNGKTSHAAEPEHGINPAHAIAQIIQEAEKYSNNIDGQDDFSVITPVHVTVGEKAYGISAGYGELHYTIRAWTNEQLDKTCKAVLATIEKVAQEHQLSYETSWTQHFRANQNDTNAVDAVVAAAQKNDYSLTHKSQPFKWGEDFGLFTQKFKGAMFGIGSGEDCPALHNPDYDFPDEIIPVGVQLFYSIYQYLQSKV